MKTRIRKVLIALTLLTFCGWAAAHEPVPYHPQPGVTGNITIWGGSHGFSGWSGNISLGQVHGYPPAYLPVLASLPSGHRHGPSCHHVPRYAHGPGHGKKHKHRRGHDGHSDTGHYGHH